MESVGNTLREARIRLGLSLEQVNSLTRISVRNLESIECDAHSVIGSPFFYKSFVRQYANVLKLSYDQLLPAIQSALSEMPEPLVPGQGGTSVPSRATVPSGHRRRYLRWCVSVASLVVVLAGCSGFYAFWQTARAGAQRSLSDLIGSGSVSSKWIGSLRAKPNAKGPLMTRPQTTPPAQDSATANLPSSSSPDSADQSAPAGSFRIEISALERSWLSVTTDGRAAFVGVLEPDQTKVLEEHDTARIKTGNAGGISCVFNGKMIGTLGPRGTIRTVIFTKNNYEVLQPAGVHMALLQFTPTGE